MPRVEDILNEANDYMLTSKNICNIEVINNNNVKPTNKKEDKNSETKRQVILVFLYNFI